MALRLFLGLCTITASLSMGTTTEENCFPDLGCFPTEAPYFHPLYRPISLAPAHPSSIAVRYYLYTRANPNNSVELVFGNEAVIKNSSLTFGRDTVFIIHGFIDNTYLGEWMHLMKNELLKVAAYNVILVDWRGGNLPPYSQAVANARVTGALVAQMINYLQKTANLSLASCHLIGHSLGAHVAGYAGKLLNKLGRISGLDPASPFFEYMPSQVRLDKHDAMFVDVIHSDVRSFNPLLAFHGSGMKQPVGHVDFYPNGGLEQPDCETVNSFAQSGVVQGFRDLLACYHDRALYLYIDSISGSCQFYGVECPSWDDYKQGKCAQCGSNDKLCNHMGFGASQPENATSKLYYLRTGGPNKLCVHQYLIFINVDRSSDQVTGTLNVKVHGGNNTTNVSFSDEAQNYEPGSTKVLLGTSEIALSQPIELELQLDQSVEFFNFRTWMSAGASLLRINQLNLIPVPSNDSNELYCFDGPVALENENSVRMKSIDCTFSVKNQFIH